MTKDKLLKLYKKFQTERLNTSFINNMKNFTNHDIYLILISKYTDITIRLMFNNNFQMLHNELKHKLIYEINRKQIMLDSEILRAK